MYAIVITVYLIITTNKAKTFRHSKIKKTQKKHITGKYFNNVYKQQLSNDEVICQ